jgi:hypothetical protein
MHGRRTALRYSPSTPSPAGARPRGRSTVLPFTIGVNTAGVTSRKKISVVCHRPHPLSTGE